MRPPENTAMWVPSSNVCASHRIQGEQPGEGGAVPQSLDPGMGLECCRQGLGEEPAVLQESGASSLILDGSFEWCLEHEVSALRMRL